MAQEGPDLLQSEARSLILGDTGPRAQGVVVGWAFTLVEFITRFGLGSRGAPPEDSLCSYTCTGA